MSTNAKNKNDPVSFYVPPDQNACDKHCSHIILFMIIVGLWTRTGQAKWRARRGDWSLQGGRLPMHIAREEFQMSSLSNPCKKS